MGNVSWAHLAVLAAVLGAAALIIVLIGRGWRRKGIGATVGLTLTGSALFAVIAALTAAGTVANILTARDVQVTVPVAEYWPAVPSGVHDIQGPTAHRSGGGFTSADVYVTGANTTARVLWALGQGIGILVPTVVATLVAVVCFQLLRGAAFTRPVARATVVTALVVLVGGLAASVFSQLGGGMVAHQLLDVTGYRFATTQHAMDLYELIPQADPHLTIPGWPVGIGLALLALAAVFRHGVRLQHDTEGLV